MRMKLSYFVGVSPWADPVPSAQGLTGTQGNYLILYGQVLVTPAPRERDLRQAGVHNVFRGFPPLGVLKKSDVSLRAPDTPMAFRSVAISRQ